MGTQRSRGMAVVTATAGHQARPLPGSWNPVAICPARQSRWLVPVLQAGWCQVQEVRKNDLKTTQLAPDCYDGDPQADRRQTDSTAPRAFLRPELSPAREEMVVFWREWPSKREVPAQNFPRAP